MANNALGTLFTDIADAIRERSGDEATMKPAAFPEAIRTLPTGGTSGGSAAHPRTVLSGSFHGDGSAQMTVAHNMGFVPDFIYVYCGVPQRSLCLDTAFGFSSAMFEAFPGLKAFCRLTFDNAGLGLSVLTYAPTDGFEGTASLATTYGSIRQVTGTTFTLGGTNCKLINDKEYYWTAVGGLV